MVFVSPAIYDRTQAFDAGAAGIMSAALLAFSITAIVIVHALGARVGLRRG